MVANEAERDVLRRHWKSCSVRTQFGIDIPEPIQAGRGRQACDECAAQKRLCDRSHPCRACNSRAKLCTYRRVVDQIQLQPDELKDSLGVDSLNGTVGDALLEPTHDARRSCFYQQQSHSTTALIPMDTTPDADNGMLARRSPTISARFDFFLHFTQACGINDAYNFKRNFAAVPDPIGQESCSTSASPTLIWAATGFALEPSCLLTRPSDVGASNIYSVQQDLLNNLSGSLRSLPGPTQLYNDPLYFKAAEIWSLFDAVLSRSSKSSGQDQQHVAMSMTRVKDFFSVSNIRRFIDIFWTRWYPHCPIIHKPTFVPEHTIPVLVMTMSLLGACTSSLLEESQDARSLLDLAEEVVFQQVPFPDTIEQYENSATEICLRVNILQAGYLMCIMQKWEGNILAKQRMRRQRFPTIVAVSRWVFLYASYLPL